MATNSIAASTSPAAARPFRSHHPHRRSRRGGRAELAVDFVPAGDPKRSRRAPTASPPRLRPGRQRSAQAGLRPALAGGESGSPKRNIFAAIESNGFGQPEAAERVAPRPTPSPGSESALRPRSCLDRLGSAPSQSSSSFAGRVGSEERDRTEAVHELASSPRAWRHCEASSAWCRWRRAGPRHWRRSLRAALSDARSR